MAAEFPEASSLSWELSDREGVTRVAFAGAIDEDCEFEPLLAALSGKGKLSFDMSGITGINSCGIREWVHFVKALGESLHGAEVHGCSPTIVRQLNLIRDFVGPATICSVQAPYVCDDCGAELSVLMDVSGGVPVLPTRSCADCGVEMVFDDIAELYFGFMS